MPRGAAVLMDGPWYRRGEAFRYNDYGSAAAVQTQSPEGINFFGGTLKLRRELGGLILD